MTEKGMSLKEALQRTDRLALTWEMVPGRGVNAPNQKKVLEMAELAANDRLLHGITLTDSPGGKPSILTYPLAAAIKKSGIEPIVHYTCKDKNRSAIESDLYALAGAGLKNLLVMTGDYPMDSVLGQAKPVFDLDSVQTLRLVETLNQKEEAGFFAGAVVSPFKETEAETMAQYYKLDKKIANGAQFIISQMGYDAKKSSELAQYMRKKHPKIALIGNVFVLSLPAARLMHANKIPGCVVSDALLREIEAEAALPGEKKERQLLRAAKLYAVLKGLNYDGINIGGHGLHYRDVKQIIEQGEALSADYLKLLPEFAYAKPGRFYLSAAQPTSASEEAAGKTARLKFFEWLHETVFAKEARCFPLIRRLMHTIEHSALKEPFTKFEFIVKGLVNRCLFCGDCVLHDLAFICPMSSCPKQQRNGACGGSCDGWCEVFPGEKRCIYVSIYQAYHATSTEKVLQERYFPPCNWRRYKTSSWLNYFRQLEEEEKEKRER